MRIGWAADKGPDRLVTGLQSSCNAGVPAGRAFHLDQRAAVLEVAADHPSSLDGLAFDRPADDADFLEVGHPDVPPADHPPSLRQGHELDSAGGCPAQPFLGPDVPIPVVHLGQGPAVGIDPHGPGDVGELSARDRFEPEAKLASARDDPSVQMEAVGGEEPG